MKALILSGGYGKRLRHLTYLTPKPMIKIMNKPVLEHIVNHLKSFGINEIYINLHYKYKKIMQYFGSNLVYSFERELLGEEGTIKSLSPYLSKDHVVVMNGDTLTNINLRRMFDLSGGKNIKYMEGDVYAGTRIIIPGYMEGDVSINYQDTESWWVDIGTFKGLKKAKEKMRDERDVRLNNLS